MDKDDRDHFKTIAAASVEPLKDLRTRPPEVSLVLHRDPQVVLLKAKQIFSCYRKDEANDPEMYVAAAAAVLAEYPAFVVDYVADPRTGIASTSKFLPSIAEIKQACNDSNKRDERTDNYWDRVERQLAAREADQIMREGRPTLAELEEKYGDGKGGWLGKPQGETNADTRSATAAAAGQTAPLQGE